MSVDISEDECIRKAIRGDQESFRHLWEVHHALAMATALRLCRHRSLAEEITQGAFVLAWRGRLDRELQTRDLDPTVRKLVRVAARLGNTARGVAFGLIGAFLILAGVQARPDQARGLGGALNSLAQQPFGPWLLGLVGLGLIGYGAHMLVAARYRRMVLD